MAKGDANEREKARKLSLWWTKGERDDAFWRVRASGARATVRAQQRKATSNQHGDIMAVDAAGLPLTEFAVIELKKGYRYDFMSVVDKNKGKKPTMFEQHILQVYGDSRAAGGLCPILISHRDYMAELITLPFFFFVYVSERVDNSILSVTMSFEKQSEKHGRIAGVIMRLDEFFTWCSPDILDRESLQKLLKENENEVY